MAKNKFYVVWDGNETGVFDSWNKCLVATKGYPQAKFKSFATLEAAKEAYSGNYFDYVGKKTALPTLSAAEMEKYGKPNLESLCVDAACSGNPGKMEYRGVFAKTNEQIFIQGPFLEATNNIGEFLALVHGLALLKEKKLELPIYSDSKIAISWIKQKRCKTNLVKTNANEAVFTLIERAEKWLQNNTFSTKIVKWETKAWGEIPADFGRK